MKRQFEVEFPHNLGPLWMNEDNLTMCLKTNVHVAGYLAQDVKVTDITDDTVEIGASNHVISYPTDEEFMELHIILDSWDDVHAKVEEWLHEYVFTDDDTVFEDVEDLPVPSHLDSEPVWYSILAGHQLG